MERVARRPARSRRSRLALAAGLLLLGGAAPAPATPLLPGESLVLPFSFAGPPVAPGGDVDTVVVDIGLSGASGLDGFVVQLRDGATVLGQQTTGVQMLWAFKSPGSSFTLSAVESELGPIVDGGIQGRIHITPLFDPGAASPGVSIDFATLSVGRGGTPPSGLLDATPGATLLEPRVVPEPGSAALLLGVGLALACAGLRRRSR